MTETKHMCPLIENRRTEIMCFTSKLVPEARQAMYVLKKDLGPTHEVSGQQEDQ